MSKDNFFARLGKAITSNIKPLVISIFVAIFIFIVAFA